MNFFVISIKKNFFTIVFVLFIISLLCFSENNLVAATNGLVLWATKVLPSLFPFFVATELLCRTNFIYILGKHFNINDLLVALFAAILLSIINFIMEQIINSIIKKVKNHE